MKIDLNKKNKKNQKDDTYVVVTYTTKIKIKITEDYYQYLEQRIDNYEGEFKDVKNLMNDNEIQALLEEKMNCISEKDIQEYFESALSDGYYSSTIDYIAAGLQEGGSEQITESFDVEMIPKKPTTTKKTKAKAKICPKK